MLRRGGIPAGVTTFSLRDNRGADVRNAVSLVLRQLYWFGEQGWEPQLVPWWRRFLPPLLGHSGTRRERRLLRRVTQTISVPAVDVRSLLSELTCSSWIWRGRSMRCSRRAGSTCAPANQRSLSKCCPGLQASAAACGPVPRRRLPRLRAARRLPAPVEAPDILPTPLLDRYGCQDMILSAEPHVDRWPPTQEGTKLDVAVAGSGPWRPTRGIDRQLGASQRRLLMRCSATPGSGGILRSTAPQRSRAHNCGRPTPGCRWTASHNDW